MINLEHKNKHTQQMHMFDYVILILPQEILHFVKMFTEVLWHNDVTA